MRPRSVEAAVAVAADPEAEAAVDRWDRACARGPVVRGGGSHVVGGAIPCGPTTGRTTAAVLRPRLRLRLRAGFSIGFYAGYPFYGYGYYGYPYPVLPAIPVLRLSLRLPVCWVPVCGLRLHTPAATDTAPSGRRTQACEFKGAAEREVYADGDYVGIVDDFDGAYPAPGTEPGAHSIEIRAPGMAADRRTT